MRLVSYTRAGEPSWGAVVGSNIVDGPTHHGEFPTVRSVLEAESGLESIAHLAGESPTTPLDEVALLPPIADPGRIFCVGINYKDHMAETGRQPTDRPTIFSRFPAAQVGAGDALVAPKVSHTFDYEGELAVIIGQGGRHIGADEALGHVAGYSCFNDGSVREFQRHTSQFLPGKNFDRSGSFGPWMVTADEIGDPTDLSLETRLNGETLQSTTTALLIFAIPELIEYLSTFTALVPGDVIATGTPGGVGSRRDPQVWMKPGDIVEVEISGIGVLSNPIIAEA